VKISFHLVRLLAILLIAGLVFAPFSGPANAGMAMGKAAPMASAEMADMAAADMPCCPDKSMPMDCDQCPLMALCMATNFYQPSPAGMIEIRPVTMRMLAPGSDPAADSLGEHPPPRPPRTLVHSA
jgi:hypothetical protein